MLVVSTTLFAQKPESEQDLNGVKLSIFKVDQKGNSTPNHAWIGVLNTSKEPMIVTGIISYSVKTKLGDKDAEVVYGSKFAQVVSPGKGSVILERDGEQVKVLEIKNVFRNYLFIFEIEH